MKNEVIYIGDPMCSWCYGFTNVIQTLRARFKDRVDFKIVMGGLHPDGDYIVDNRYGDFLRAHWIEIGTRTGQPFDLSILNNKGWIYDTEKPCRATVAVRRLKPEVEWEYFAAAQKSFYHQNHNPNDPASFANIAAQFGINPELFLETYHEKSIIDETQSDFRWARSVGVSSFPTVLLRNKRGLSILTVGYRPLEPLEAILNDWLKSPDTGHTGRSALVF